MTACAKLTHDRLHHVRRELVIGLAAIQRRGACRLLETSAEARKVGVNAIKTMYVHFTMSMAMKEVLSPANTEFALQADIANDRCL